MSLKISPKLSLPDEAVTQTFAILAKRGVGKTYTASVMAEEMIKNNLPVVILDPIGVWWGLRSSADGKGPGLAITIAGGDHADVPIEPTSGEVLANLIVDDQLSMVIDLSLFRKGEQTRFVTDFAETLYHRNRQALHVIVDEADAFAPQRPQKGQERMLGAMEDIVRRGRARGIGVTLITQRPAVLNKDVLTQVEVLVTLRMIAPQDRKAIDDWVNVHGTPEQREELMSSLPSLPIGTAWFWSPGWLDLFQRVEIRKRETLDSSSTPTAGAVRVKPQHMAKVDLDKIRTQLKATIEKVESEDPKVLKRRIIELERQLANQKPEIKKIETPILSQEDIENLQKAAAQVIHVGQAIADSVSIFAKGTTITVPITHSFAKPNANKITPVTKADIRPQMQISDDKLGPGELKILTAAGQFPNGISRSQLTILAGYKRSSRNTYIGRLSKQGLIEVSGDMINITAAGVAALGSDYDPLPIGDELRERLLRELPQGEKVILEALIEAYPDGLTRDEVTDAAGYTRSSRNTYLGRMKAREIIVIDGSMVRASDSLFTGV